MQLPEAPVQSELEKLRAGIDAATPLFVLIDPMVGEPVDGIGTPPPDADPASLRAESWGRNVLTIELPKSISLPLTQYPYLIQLNGADDPLLELTFELAMEEQIAARSGGLDGSGRAAHRIGGWLQSSMRWHDLSKLLASMCTVNTEAITNASYLRLGDRRVLDLLRHVAGDDRVSAQLGRIQSWRYLDSHGKLCRLDSPAEEPVPLLLSVAEWHEMAGGELLHRALAMYAGDESISASRTTLPGYQAAKHAIAEAVAAARIWPHRFRALDDNLVWATLVLWRPTIGREPAIRALLAQPGTDEDPPEPVRFLYRDLMALVATGFSPEPL
jgi:hypothetical protein